MASMLSDSAKEALSGAQETVLYLFGIVIALKYYFIKCAI